MRGNYASSRTGINHRHRQRQRHRHNEDWSFEPDISDLVSAVKNGVTEVKKEVAERKRPSFTLTHKLSKDKHKTDCDLLLSRAFVFAEEEDLVEDPLNDLQLYFYYGGKAIDAYLLRGSILYQKSSWLLSECDISKGIKMAKMKHPIHTFISKRFHWNAQCDECFQKFTFNGEGKYCIHCKTMVHSECLENHRASKMAEMYNFRGVVRYHRGHFDEAEKDLNRAIVGSRDVGTRMVYIGNRGLVFFEKKWFEKSIADFCVGIKANPQDELLLQLCSAAYFNLGIISEAREFFLRAEKLASIVSVDSFFPFSLPRDVLFEVFQHLPPSSQISFALTCQDWLTIAKGLSPKNSPRKEKKTERRSPLRNTEPTKSSLSGSGENKGKKTKGEYGEEGQNPLLMRLGLGESTKNTRGGRAREEESRILEEDSNKISTSIKSNSYRKQTLLDDDEEKTNKKRRSHSNPARSSSESCRKRNIILEQEEGRRERSVTVERRIIGESDTSIFRTKKRVTKNSGLVNIEES